MVDAGATPICIHLHVSCPLYYCAKNADISFVLLALNSLKW